MAASVESAGQGTQLYVRGPASRGARGVTIGQACFHCCPFRHPTWSVPAAPLLNRLGANSPEGRSRWPAPACGAPDGWLVLAVVAIYTVSQSREGFLNSAFQRNQKGGSAVRHGSGQEGPRNPRSRAQSGTCVSQVSGPEWQECPVSRERGPGRRDGGGSWKEGPGCDSPTQDSGCGAAGSGESQRRLGRGRRVGWRAAPGLQEPVGGAGCLPQTRGSQRLPPEPRTRHRRELLRVSEADEDSSEGSVGSAGGSQGDTGGKWCDQGGSGKPRSTDTRVDTRRHTRGHIHTRTHTWTHTPTLIHLWAHVQTLTVTHTRP